jgi:hypothetical protein
MSVAYTASTFRSSSASFSDRINIAGLFRRGAKIRNKPLIKAP